MAPKFLFTSTPTRFRRFRKLSTELTRWRSTAISSLSRWRSRRGLRTAALLAGLSLSAVAAHAQDATWNQNGTGNFNTNTNWTPATVPTGTAFFGVSNQNIVSFSAGTTIDSWTFNA